MKRKGFVSLGILLTMSLILTMAWMGSTSISGLRKTYQSSALVRENYLISENFVTYYQIFVTEKIKETYMSIPYDPRYELDKSDISKINYRMLNSVYGALAGSWNYEFETAMTKEDTELYLGYELYSIQVSRQRYNRISKKYVDYNGDVYDSDFRVTIKMQLLGEKGQRKQLDTMVYFYIPDYSLEQQNQWLAGEDIILDEKLFKEDILTQVGDSVAFG